MLSLIFNCVESLHVTGDEVLFIKASMKVRGFSNDMYNLGYYKEKKTERKYQPYISTAVCHTGMSPRPLGPNYSDYNTLSISQAST